MDEHNIEGYDSKLFTADDNLVNFDYSSQISPKNVYDCYKNSNESENEVLKTSYTQSLSENDNNDVNVDATFANSKEEHQIVLSIIENVKITKALSIDLSRKCLQSIPEPLLDLSHLEYLYLEGNDICYLPDDFFKLFPCLIWLDLRNNMLSHIPSLHLSSHSSLRNLLLEGNKLCNLPLELGLVLGLHGLNIAGNPLEFPPQNIIETGTQGILQFLRDILAHKKAVQYANTDLLLSRNGADEQLSDCSDDWNTSASMMDLAKAREAMKVNQSDFRNNASNPGDLKQIVSKEMQKAKFGDFLVTGDLGTNIGHVHQKSISASSCLRINQAPVTQKFSTSISNDIISFFKKALKK